MDCGKRNNTKLVFAILWSFWIQTKKIIDKAVAGAIKLAAAGTLGGSNYVGSLANGGVNIAPFHDLSVLVTADLQTGLTALKGKIADGSVKVADYLK